MRNDDDFLPRLGRGGRDRSFASEVRRSANPARGGARVPGSGRRFTGARIRRGAGVGAMLATRDGRGAGSGRRVVVKARIVTLAGKGAAGAAAHLRYLQRDGTTRGGERGTLYGANEDMVATLERCDLARIGAQLSRELGVAYVEPQSGERIEERLVKPLSVGDVKFALIQKAREFTLVPWRPTLEKQVGKEVAGIMRGTGSISWTVGRSRGLGID